jgi:hypothetical protein
MKSVRLKFGTSDGKKRTISLQYPRADITELEVRSAMQALIDNNIFVNSLTAIASAEMVETTVTPLIEG